MVGRVLPVLDVVVYACVRVYDSVFGNEYVIASVTVRPVEVEGVVRTLAACRGGLAGGVAVLDELIVGEDGYGLCLGISVEISGKEHGKVVMEFSRFLEKDLRGLCAGDRTPVIEMGVDVEELLAGHLVLELCPSGDPLL